MLPKRFEYIAPSNLADAIKFLSQHEGAKILAGGHSLIPLLKLRLFTPNYLVDLNRLRELDYVRNASDQFRIGALTRYATLEEDERIRKSLPALSDAVAQIGDPLVRNVGTIGGNICHCDPANDLPAVMLALDADLVVAGLSGQRTIPAERFFLNTFQTALTESEILVEVRIPSFDLRTGSAYAKLERRVGDFPTVAVAARIQLDGQGVCQDAGLGLTAVGPKALRAQRAENVLLGKTVGEEEIQDASSLAAEQASPVSDLRGSTEYKRAMTQVLTARALRLAMGRAEMRR